MKLVGMFFAVLVLLPIVLYINQFGFGVWCLVFGVWTDHSKWAEMGSFFGGVLGPIITVISVTFLYVQLKEHQKQQQYTLDTLKLQKIESDIAFFSSIVKSELERKIPTMNNRVLSDILSHHAAEVCSVHTSYQGNKDPDLIIKEFGKRSFDFLICYESLFASWNAINAQLHSLIKLDLSLGMENYKSQRARVFASLDSILCTHLDTISMSLDQKFAPHFRPTFEHVRHEVQQSLAERT
ncbi:hypothetical protein L4D76_24260 [Photobacterium sagamiensis]|uniref:hypothetical protein n=1 Tax=Photobacterium sagamiensis TaxID=2910241 RepID=UPI003D0DB165